MGKCVLLSIDSVGRNIQQPSYFRFVTRHVIHIPPLQNSFCPVWQIVLETLQSILLSRGPCVREFSSSSLIRMQALHKIQPFVWKQHVVKITFKKIVIFWDTVYTTVKNLNFKIYKIDRLIILILFSSALHKIAEISKRPKIIIIVPGTIFAYTQQIKVKIDKNNCAYKGKLVFDLLIWFYTKNLNLKLKYYRFLK